MGRIFFRKRDRIRQLEAENWSLKLKLERQDFSFQLTVPVLTTKREQEEVRFSGSPEAIELLQKSFDMRYRKRKPAPKTKATLRDIVDGTPAGEAIIKKAVIASNKAQERIAKKAKKIRERSKH